MNEEALFHLACEKPPDERAAFLDEACAGDTALRQRLEVLLAAHDEPGSFLQSAARDYGNGEPAPNMGRTVLQTGVQEVAGSVIGHYKLLQQIGEGGMGVVFMAEQSRPVRRTVALKIIKPGMDSRQVIARFEAERQALAMMDHPNIARVLDAGTTDSGRPYFVMELVKGVPITKYCDEHRLTPQNRLELFVHVCHAVQHAHQKGIIHRDLKPSNVLIAQYDGKPVPKVIDFGVAKATGQQLTERTMFTSFGDVIGTPEYMSPEQAELNQLDIDTRSDVYSLGVLLYELLTGTTPIEHKRVKEAALLEVLRVIREEEPPTPSTRLSTAEGLPSIAANRGLEPKKLSGLVKGELDWIVMKSLEKDRTRRYETASGLAMDVHRYLHDEPVQACPPSAGYRLRKFARRNRTALLAVSLIAAAVFVGLITTIWQAVRATGAERVAKAEAVRASQEAATATAVNNFLNDLLSQASPDQEPNREIKLRTVLDRAAIKADTSFRDQPLVEAAIRTTLSWTYKSLGEFAAEDRHAKRAWELYRRELGDEHPKTLKSAERLAWAYLNRGAEESGVREGRYVPSPLVEQGRQLFEQTLAIERRVLGEAHRDTLISMNGLASALDYQDKPAEGRVILERALPLARQSLGGEDSITLAMMNNLANTMRKIGLQQKDEKLQLEAIGLYQQALDAERRVRGKEHPQALHLEDAMAHTFYEMGRDEEGIKHRISPIDGRRRVLGEEHRETVWSVYHLWLSVERLATRAPGGAARAVELTEGMTQALPESGAAWTAVAMARYQAGDWKSAIEALEKSEDLRKGSSSIDWLLRSMAYAQLGNRDEAQKWYNQAAQLIDKNRADFSDHRGFRAAAAEVLKMAHGKPTTEPESN